MNKIIIVLTVLAVCIVCAQVAKASVRKISGEDAHKMMSEMKDFVLLDVRTESEFKEKRIQGAILIPDFEIKTRAEKELKNKNQVIFVYCRSGRRSANAAEELAKMGYTKVYDFGGILDWKRETVSD
ncbi:MAG: rhodanese-like domain-containing protein [Fibromonadales bacterium]|nr:rhodanese-like domain-containing protein [Fibromonadales bacterium]